MPGIFTDWQTDDFADFRLEKAPTFRKTSTERTKSINQEIDEKKMLGLLHLIEHPESLAESEDRWKRRSDIFPILTFPTQTFSKKKLSKVPNGSATVGITDLG